MPLSYFPLQGRLDAQTMPLDPRVTIGHWPTMTSTAMRKKMMPEKMFFNVTAVWGLMWQEQPSNWHLTSSRCTARVMVITETEPQKSNNWMSRTGSHKTDNFLKYSCRVREIFCAKPKANCHWLLEYSWLSFCKLISPRLDWWPYSSFQLAALQRHLIAGQIIGWEARDGDPV